MPEPPSLVQTGSAAFLFLRGDILSCVVFPYLQVFPKGCCREFFVQPEAGRERESPTANHYVTKSSFKAFCYYTSFGKVLGGQMPRKRPPFAEAQCMMRKSEI